MTDASIDRLKQIVALPDGKQQRDAMLHWLVELEHRLNTQAAADETIRVDLRRLKEQFDGRPLLAERGKHVQRIA